MDPLNVSNIGIFFSAMLLLWGGSGCQSVKIHNDRLIDTSLVCEIPTLAGNLAGGIVTFPLLAITAPIGYLAYPGNETGREEAGLISHGARENFILAPMHAGSYLFGILTGTPFYPLGLVFPREKAEHSKVDEQNNAK